ncbi:MAG TPA: hypothetical protein VGM07_03365 [Stellaceae bacterium]|jgi:hypothetical protein
MADALPERPAFDQQGRFDRTWVMLLNGYGYNWDRRVSNDNYKILEESLGMTMEMVDNAGDAATGRPADNRIERSCC